MKPDEVVRILGSLNINELEHVLNEIKIQRITRLQDDVTIPASKNTPSKLALIISQ